MDAQASIERKAVLSLVRHVRTLVRECESNYKDGVTEGFGFVKELIRSCDQVERLQMDMTGPDNAKSEQPENAFSTEQKSIATEVSSVIDNLRSTEEGKRKQGAIGLRSIYKSHVRIEKGLLEDCIQPLVDLLNSESEGVQNEAVTTILDITKRDVWDTHCTAECEIFLTQFVPALWEKLERGSSFCEALILALRNICTSCETYYDGPRFLVKTMEARGLDILLKLGSTEDASFLISYICDELVFFLNRGFRFSEKKKSAADTLLEYSVRHKELRKVIVKSKYMDYIIEAAGEHGQEYELLRENAMALLINIHGGLWEAILSISGRLNLSTLPALARAVARYDSKTESESSGVSDPLIIVKALDRLLNCVFVPSGIEVLARLYEHAVFSKKLASTEKSRLVEVHDEVLSTLNKSNGLKWYVAKGCGREVIQVLLSIHRLSSKQQQRERIQGMFNLVRRNYVETGQDTGDIARLVVEFETTSICINHSEKMTGDLSDQSEFISGSPAPDAKLLEMETDTLEQQKNPMNKESIIQVCGLSRSVPDIRWEEKEKLPYQSPGLSNNQKSAKAVLKRINTISSFIPEQCLLESPSSVLTTETKI